MNWMSKKDIQFNLKRKFSEINKPHLEKEMNNLNNLPSRTGVNMENKIYKVVSNYF